MPRKNYKNKLKKLSPVSLNNCQSKVRYDSKDKANKSAEMRNLENLNLNLEVYKCDMCSGWHLTSRTV